MFHFGGGIPLGVDIGNFLKLESSLESDREIYLPANREEIIPFMVFGGDLLYFIFILQNPDRPDREWPEERIEAPSPAERRDGACAPEKDGDLGEESYLGSEGFVEATPISAPAWIDAAVTFAGDG